MSEERLISSECKKKKKIKYKLKTYTSRTDDDRNTSRKNDFKTVRMRTSDQCCYYWRRIKRALWSRIDHIIRGEAGGPDNEIRGRPAKRTRKIPRASRALRLSSSLRSVIRRPSRGLYVAHVLHAQRPFLGERRHPTADPPPPGREACRKAIRHAIRTQRRDAQGVYDNDVNRRKFQGGGLPPKLSRSTPENPGHKMLKILYF